MVYFLKFLNPSHSSDALVLPIVLMIVWPIVILFCQVHPRPCSLAVGSGWGFLVVVKVASIVCCHRA